VVVVALLAIGDSNLSSITNPIDLHMCANKYIIHKVNRDPIDCGKKTMKETVQSLTTLIIGNKGCVTMWPCHLHQKVS